MKNELNPEILEAFLQPAVDRMVENKFNALLEKKILELKLAAEPEKPILIEKASEILGYSRSHLYYLCRSGMIPHVRRGRWLYFYISELNHWLRQ